MTVEEGNRPVMEEGAEETYGLLAEQRLERTGLEVKLDRGFAEGTYGVTVEFDDLARRAGFADAHRTVTKYCTLLKDQLSRMPGHSLGETEDASLTGDPRRKRDLESTFLSFAIDTADGRFHDAEVREQFRLALLRTGQSWDQAQAGSDAHRRHSRREKFRQQLARLLEGEGYAQVDGAVKERLLDEVPALAFPARGTER
jgi:hypothetical protein